MKSTSFAPDQQIGRYTIRKLLAQGGMAEVYKADQELTAGIFRPVALKVIRPEYSGSPDFREMFLDEARCACGLSHPNIVQIFDVGEADGLVYMAMELVPGETLSTVNRTLREHQDKLTDEALYAVGIYCASALEAVHALTLHDSHVNLVHRDVSPHNLLLSSRGSLKLIDFGIAKAATNRNLTSPGVTKGKAGYFSPEQAMGKALDGRSDLFSLGVTLYKLACNHTPFDHHASHAERNGALVRGQWKPLQEVQPGLSPGLYDVIAKSMKLKPDDRYATAAEMREALEHAAFQAGYRIGSKSLLGYVTDDGAITAVPTGSRQAASVANLETRIGETKVAPARSNSQGEVTVSQRPDRDRSASRPKLVVPQVHNTVLGDRERVTDKVLERPRMRKRKNPLVLLAAFATAVALGGIVTLTLWGSGDDPVPEPQPVPMVAKPTEQKPAEQKPPEQRPAAPAEPDPQPLPADEPVADVQPDEPVAVEKSPAVKPPKRHVRAPAPKAERVEKPAEPAPEVIPAGQGQLRISTTPANVASRVTVGKNDWGPAPVNQRIASGRYVVTVVLPGGKKSPEWVGNVMPDGITTIIFDIDSGKWQRR
ncbi:MAG: protein kinase [Myxococcaceae bacterium]|nr:protein kinase [Myxococcaceae bacterium]